MTTAATTAPVLHTSAAIRFDKHFCFISFETSKLLLSRCLQKLSENEWTWMASNYSYVLFILRFQCLVGVVEKTRQGGDEGKTKDDKCRQLPTVNQLPTIDGQHKNLLFSVQYLSASSVCSASGGKFRACNNCTLQERIL